MDYLIRQIKTKDLVALVDLCQQHAAHERANYSPTGKHELLAKALFSDQPNLFCLVVEVNRLVVGYASYTFDVSTWDAQTFLYLDCLYLEPDYRGFGIGASIMNRLKIIATEKNCINIQWQTPVFNTQAIKFYNRIGGVGNNKVRFCLDL